MSSLVSLANDIFAADLNELDQFREQLELRAAAQQKRAEREEVLQRRSAAEKEVERRKEREQQQQQQQQSSAHHGRAGAAAASRRGGGGGSSRNASSPAKGGGGSGRRGAGDGSRPTSARGTSISSAENALNAPVPPPVVMPVTDLTGVVPESRVDPFLSLVQALDSHATAVADANAPYQRWMKKRLRYLTRRRNLVAGAEPIPEDVLGDNKDDGTSSDDEQREGKLLQRDENGQVVVDPDAAKEPVNEQPPPLAIPILEFTRRHAEELKRKYSYQPPRGLLTAGKVTKGEAAAMAESKSDGAVTAQLATHDAGSTWKAPEQIKGGDAVVFGSGTSKQRSGAAVTMDLDTATNVTRRSRVSRRTGSAAGSRGGGRRGSVGGASSHHRDSGTGSDTDFGAGGLTHSDSFGGGSDFTGMYVNESKGAEERRVARQREADRFHAKLRSALEFSSNRLQFRECIPHETYKQTFRVWNRSSDLRRFKVMAGSSDALAKSRIPGRNLDVTWGRKKQAEEKDGTIISSSSTSSPLATATGGEGNSSMKHQNQDDDNYDLDGKEAFDIPHMEVRVTSPANFSPDKAIAPGTSLVVEVTVRPHWSAYETAECSLAVAHVRDVNSHVRDKNDLSQWHCEEMPVTVEMLQPRLVFDDVAGSSSSSSNNSVVQKRYVSVASSEEEVSVSMPTCFFGNKVTEQVRITNAGAKAIFSLRLQPMINQFTVSPNFLELDRGASEIITITHTPREDQHGSKNVDTATMTFEGSLVPSDDAHQHDAAAVRKGRRRVLKQVVHLSGTGTDACVFVSTIGTAPANQLAMKGHRGVDAVGTVNVNDAVVGFGAWRPVTVTNDSELAVPVQFVSTCASHGQLAVLDVRPARAVVPPRAACTVELWLSTRKELLQDPILLQKEIAGRFFMYVPRSSGVPEVAVQRAHERRFDALRPKTVPRSPRDEMALIKNINSSSSGSSSESSQQADAASSCSPAFANKIVKNDIFIEEFDVASKPSKPALSFTPTLLNLTDVEALTNQTNVCDAILRNDGAGELSFYFMSVGDREGLQATGFSPKKMMRRAVNYSSSDDDANDGQHQGDEAEEATSAEERTKLLVTSQQAGSKLLERCGVDVGHYFDEKGGIEWWAVPAQGTIAPGVELRVSIRYVVRRAGPARAVLEAFSPLLGGTSSPHVTVEARGRGPSIRASVPSIEFGTVSYGQESEARFQLFNPTENAVLVSVRDAHANDGPEYAQLERDTEGTMAAAKTKRLVVAPGQCTLHPRQTVTVTVYLRAVHAGKNEDFVLVEVEDGTDLMIPFSGEVVVPELVVTPTSINLGKVDRDVVLPCSVLLSNLSCIPIAFEVSEIDALAGVCSIDLIGCTATVPAGALNVPINFTVCFEQTKDAPVSVTFAFASPSLDAPVLLQLETENVCQPKVSLAVTLPGQALFCQSTEGFVGAMLHNIIDDAVLESVKKSSSSNNNKRSTEKEDLVGEQQHDDGEDEVVEAGPRIVAPYVDPIVLTGQIDRTLPYCAQDFEVLIRNPTGCVFPCSARPMRYPASSQSQQQQRQLGADEHHHQTATTQHLLTPAPPAAVPATTAGAGGVSTTSFPAGSAAAQSARSLPGRSTRLPGIGSSAASATTASAASKAPPPPVPALTSHTAGRTFFCRDEDGTDAQDRAREAQLAAAAALVQTGRELAVEITSKDTQPARPVACTLQGYDVHTLGVRCLATIPGVFREKLRLDFGTGVPSTELPVTVRVSGAPIVVDPSTSAMTTDPASGVTKLQLPSVVAGMRSVKRTIQITSRCPRDLRVDCRIAVTGSSVGSALLPSDIFGGDAAVSTALFSKEGGGGGGGALAMERNWATVAPGSFVLGALQSAQLTVEYAPPPDARVPTWEGVLHISSTIAQTAFNDKFLISEFYEVHEAEFPAQRSLSPVAVGERMFAQNSGQFNGASGAAAAAAADGKTGAAAPAPIRVKGVAKLPLRVPVIKRAGVLENGVLVHRQAAQLVANQQYEAEQEASKTGQSPGGSVKKERKRYTDDSSSDDGEFDDEDTESQQQKQQRQSHAGKKGKKVEDPKEMLARIRRERPTSAAEKNNNSNGNSSFDAVQHEACVAETVLILHHLRRRYEELAQFTAGGFIEPTQLNLHVKHLKPLLDIDPCPVVRLPKCFVPMLPPDLLMQQQRTGTTPPTAISPTPPLSIDLVAASSKKLTPLPSNCTVVRLQNNGITTIDARLFLAAATAQHFKVVGFTRKHGDARPKRAAAKYEPSPVESGVVINEDGSWTSSQFRIVPQEIVDLDVALFNAAGNTLSSLLARRTMPVVAEDPKSAAPFCTLAGNMDLRFSNGEAQAVQLSAHVFVPRVSLVEDKVEFLPTVEVSLGRGQPTLSRRITLINASPCPAAFEITPIMKMELAQQQQQQKLRFEGEGGDDEDVPDQHGQRHGVAKAAAAALKKPKQQNNNDANANETAVSGGGAGTVKRRAITVKAAANSVDAVGARNSTAPLYDPGRFRFSQQSGHLPPASAAGAPSRLEVDVFFDPFASQLYNAEFEVAVEGGIGSKLFVLAQSRVTEV